MKRTEQRLKSKGIRNHKPSDAHAYFAFRYDRNYIRRKMGDVTHLPFSRGSVIVSVKRYRRSARIGTIIAEEPVPL